MLIALYPDAIADLAKQAYADRLFTEHGMARWVFRQPDSIRAIVAIPGVGWSMFHKVDFVQREEYWVSTYVKPSDRGRGIGRSLVEALGEATSLDGARFSIVAREFYRKCFGSRCM